MGRQACYNKQCTHEVNKDLLKVVFHFGQSIHVRSLDNNNLIRKCPPAWTSPRSAVFYEEKRQAPQ